MNCQILSGEINSKILLINEVKLQVFDDGRIYKFNKIGELILLPNTPNVKAGYNQLQFNNKKFYRHRIIGFTFLGLDINNSKQVIDHINHDKLNNNVSNLRVITQHHNMWNYKSMNNQKIKGYVFDKSRNKWSANISINNKKKHLGRYNTEEEASAAYQAAKLIYHQIVEINSDSV